MLCKSRRRICSRGHAAPPSGRRFSSSNGGAASSRAIAPWSTLIQWLCGRSPRYKVCDRCGPTVSARGHPTDGELKAWQNALRLCHTPRPSHDSRSAPPSLAHRCCSLSLRGPSAIFPIAPWALPNQLTYPSAICMRRYRLRVGQGSTHWVRGETPRCSSHTQRRPSLFPRYPWV